MAGVGDHVMRAWMAGVGDHAMSAWMAGVGDHAMRAWMAGVGDHVMRRADREVFSLEVYFPQDRFLVCLFLPNIFPFSLLKVYLC